MTVPDKIFVSELLTLVVGLIALFVGGRIRRAVPFLRRIDMPNAVVGAMIVAILVLLGQVWLGTEIVFGERLRDFLLLVFFTTIGLSAKFSALKAGGRPLIIVCVVTVVLLVAQNVAGTLVALVWGAHPFYGLLAGSISFVGGPGTALAWAKEAEAAGLRGALVVGIGAATLAVITGALIAGPITGWIVSRHGLRSTTTPGSFVSFVAPRAGDAAHGVEDSGTLERILSTVFVITFAVLIGDYINAWAKDAGLVLPGFLSAMVAGILITNLADLGHARLEFAPIEQGGEVALHLFLVMSLMGVKLIAVAAILMPLVINLVVQVAVIVAVGYFILFRLLGGDYDAAVTVGGFLGFGISSMPVAMATMDEIADRYGPAPKAFLLITLAGSFFVDLANAIITKAFLSLPLYAIGSPAAGG